MFLMNPSAEAPFKEVAIDTFQSHHNLRINPTRSAMIQHVLQHREAILTKAGALAVWNPAGETGRIPKDTYTVRRAESEGCIDWSSPFAVPLQPETFDRLWQDACSVLEQKETIFSLDRSIGADPAYELPITVVTDSGLTSLFADNMFRPRSTALHQSIFAEKPFTLLVVPHDKIQTEAYEGVLRKNENKTVDMLIAMDLDRRLGLVYGTRYCGAVKKLFFTAMNYYLPAEGILPLHCSANEDTDGNTALFLGLSGTGKTTLSNHPGHRCIGDDEHAWSNTGIANFENGCYAKLLHLSSEKEPEIYNAVFTERPYLENGCIVENAMVYPDGSLDLVDDRFAENSRTSYPLSFLPHIKESGTGTHPHTIIFLTADAHGVLPPVAKLHSDQAMLWFLMGYTSKLAGTEAGITTPVSTFSRFFGGPFMLRKPSDYAELLGKKMQEHHADVYLVNTGWTGGAYGVGKRMDITVTRAIVEAILSGAFQDTEYRYDERWKVQVPVSCPGVESSLLQPRSTWSDSQAYDKAADALAMEFAQHFQKTYSTSGFDPTVIQACPGM